MTSFRYPFYHFDRHTKSCRPFSYSGCGGNENRFMTLSQCHGLCEPFMLMTGNVKDNNTYVHIAFRMHFIHCLLALDNLITDRKNDGFLEILRFCLEFSELRLANSHMNFNGIGVPNNKQTTGFFTETEMDCYFPLDQGFGKNNKTCVDNAGYRFHFHSELGAKFLNF